MKPSDQTQGIRIGGTLYNGQIFYENYIYRHHINSVLNKNYVGALSNLINVPCGGGAGCYDHGAVIVQILYTIGDNNFSKLVSELTSSDKAYLLALMRVGFEYGNFKEKDILIALKSRFQKTGNIFR